jgi:hypothetical protein
MFWHRHQPNNSVCVSSGVVENPDSLMDITAHIYVGTTIDGGLSEWLPLPRWRGDEDSSELLASEWKGSPAEDLTPATLRAHCHCGGVEFLIKRPREPEEVGKRGTFPLGRSA